MEMKQRTLEKRLSPAAAWAFAIGTSVGWGSLVVTNSAYLAQAGVWGSVIGMLIGTLIMIVIGRNYAYMMQCYPEAGGTYTYVREQFGYDHGFLTAWFLVLTYLAMLWANATSLPLFAKYFLGDLFRFGRLYSLFGYDVYIGETLLTLLAIGVTAWFCIRFKSAAAKIMIVLSALFTLCVAAVFLGAIVRLEHPLTPSFVPDSGALSQIVKIAVISPWAFIGFESISHSAEEFSFKHSRFFRVLVVAVVSTTLLYLMITLLSVTAYPPEYSNWLEYIRDLGNLDGIRALPAFYAARYYLGDAGLYLLMAALIALIATSLIGNMTSLSRLFFALGRDRLLPERFASVNRHGAPGQAILLVLCLSLPVPFLGRTAIGWIVDVTTIGATIIYAFVSAAALKLARSRNDTLERRTGLIGLVLMVAYLLYLLLPNLVSEGDMARESFFLFIVWSILGFLFFRRILHQDHESRFGKSVIVWVALLALVLFIALIWMRQSMIFSNHQMMANIRDHYLTTEGVSAARLADEQFISMQMNELEIADTRTILMSTGMFIFALLIMISNYSFMSKQTKESEKLANTDAMTGVKNKHAYMRCEQNLNTAIQAGKAQAFAIVVCDVNGLKFINDNYGHKAGDDYIRSACAVICEFFQHSPVFRTGGDEFVVVLSGRDYDRRQEIVEALRQKSESSIRDNGVVISSGISDYVPEKDQDCHTVFARADSLMYENKQALKRMGAKTR